VPSDAVQSIGRPSNVQVRVAPSREPVELDVDPGVLEPYPASIVTVEPAPESCPPMVTLPFDQSEAWAA
jgi:hypothetical protein